MCPAEISGMGSSTSTLQLAVRDPPCELDLQGNEIQTGKRVGKDAEAGKATLHSLIGIEKARSRAEKHRDRALQYLQQFGEKADALKTLIHSIVDRMK